MGLTAQPDSLSRDPPTPSGTQNRSDPASMHTSVVSSLLLVGGALQSFTMSREQNQATTQHVLHVCLQIHKHLQGCSQNANISEDGGISGDFSLSSLHFYWFLMFSKYILSLYSYNRKINFILEKTN